MNLRDLDFCVKHKSVIFDNYHLNIPSNKLIYPMVQVFLKKQKIFVGHFLATVMGRGKSEVPL